MSAKEQISDTTHKITDKARELAGAAELHVNSAAHAAGAGLEKISGAVGRGSTSVTQGVERMGRFLQERDLRDMGGEVTRLVRRYPITSLMVGLGVGFLLRRLLK